MIDLADLLSVADAALDQVVPRLADPDVRSNISVETKSSMTDMVTEIDRWSEATIVDTIAALRPADGFLGEEGASLPSETGVVWVIDPIDGTTNFLYDLPGFSISIAARVDGVDLVGAVHDPIRDERFRAIQGRGATRNGAPIHASAIADLGTSLVATGFSYEADRRRAQAEALTILLPEVRDIRRFGGAALDLCAVACGRVDAYYERGLGPWDCAAGAVIAAEAGAIVQDRQPPGGAFAAAAPGIAAEFFALVDNSGANTA
ncbi:inositol monophosphatase [Acidimicrobiales bacterium]|nr:inositol monophosphatase [Acidimicrobiales bacterium]